jgi:hypothetical protein
MMIYWIISSLRPRWPLAESAFVAGGVAAGVELFKLYRTPPLDAFRHTLAGALLLGRVFAVWDLIAYASAIAAAALIDRAIRARISRAPAPHA